MKQEAGCVFYMYLLLVVFNHGGICKSDNLDKSRVDGDVDGNDMVCKIRHRTDKLMTIDNNAFNTSSTEKMDFDENKEMFSEETDLPEEDNAENTIDFEETDMYVSEETDETEDILNTFSLADQLVNVSLPSQYFSVAETMDFDNFVRFLEESICGDLCLSVPLNFTVSPAASSLFACDGCACDGCRIYGDCCLDRVLDGEKLNNTLLQYTTCTTPTQGLRTKGQGESYILVTECPAGYDVDTVREKCEYQSTKFETILNNPPVYSLKSQMNYLNSHCAECHKDLGHLKEWTSQVTCKKAISPSSIKTMDDLVRLISTSDCSMFEPPNDSLSRRCTVNPSRIITECNVTGDWFNFNTALEKACGMYANHITIDSLKYQNVFCALCNGKRSDIIEKWSTLYQPKEYDMSEEESEMRTAPSFSIIFNLRPRQKSPERLDDSKCPETSLLVPEGLCRQLVCSPGRILLAHSCQDAFKTAQGLGYKLRYHLLSIGQSTFVDRNDIEKFGTTYHNNISNHYYSDDLFPVQATIITNIFYKSTLFKDIVSIENVQTDIRAVIGWDISQHLAEITLLKMFGSEWEFQDTVWKGEAVDHRLPSDPGLECESFCHQIRDGVPNDFPIHPDMFIPLTPVSRCNQTELSPDEYTINHTTGVLKTNVTGEDYKKGEYTLNGTRVRICLNVSSLDNHSGTQKDKLFQKNMKMVTTVSLGVSICCLFFTISLLVVTGTRKTLPGKITIALVSTLIIAQMLFITSSLAVGDLWKCRLVGLAIHYSWLAVFSWKHVAGYHMYVSFVHPFRKSSNHLITFIRYTLYAFGTPLAIVAGYTTIHLLMSDNDHIGYGDDVCFLSSPQDIGVAFVLPVFIVIVSNAFFFGRVFQVIRKMSAFQKHSNRSNTNHSIIFIKMSVVLGFTWVIGFLANVKDSHVMWYIFAVLNAGIGVFLLIGQVWNNQILRRLCRSADFKRKTDSNTSLSNINSDSKNNNS